MKKFLLVLLILGGCNSMYIKPGTLDPNAVFYSTAGGYSMKRSIKERLEQRGYDVRIGKMTLGRKVGTSDGGVIDIDEYKMENVRYVINVSERSEKFCGLWCIFNGFWWWNFNVSIGDQETGEEIFTWRGRGCANSSLRKLDSALDKLEMKEYKGSPTWTRSIIKDNKPG